MREEECVVCGAEECSDFCGDCDSCSDCCECEPW